MSTMLAASLALAQRSSMARRTSRGATSPIRSCSAPTSPQRTVSGGRTAAGAASLTSIPLLWVRPGAYLLLLIQLCCMGPCQCMFMDGGMFGQLADQPRGCPCCRPRLQLQGQQPAGRLLHQERGGERLHWCQLQQQWQQQRLSTLSAQQCSTGAALCLPQAAGILHVDIFPANHSSAFHHPERVPPLPALPPQARANFEGADLSDTLMDRAVVVEANLRNAILQRAVLTRSDLRDADIKGADFTNALVDKAQQMVRGAEGGGGRRVHGACMGQRLLVCVHVRVQGSGRAADLTAWCRPQQQAGPFAVGNEWSDPSDPLLGCRP